jgi:hypothetical protein
MYQPPYQPPRGQSKLAIGAIVISMASFLMSCGALVAAGGDGPNASSQSDFEGVQGGGDFVAPTITETVTPSAVSPKIKAAKPKPKISRSPAPKAKPKPLPPVSSNDPRYSSCAKANAAGYGPYSRGETEYNWYQDRDGDGRVCER